MALTVLVWTAIRTQAEDISRRSIFNVTIFAAILITAIIIAIGLTRYLGPQCCLTPSHPPDIAKIAAGFALVGTFSLLSSSCSQRTYAPLNCSSS